MYTYQLLREYEEHEESDNGQFNYVETAIQRALANTLNHDFPIVVYDEDSAEQEILFIVFWGDVWEKRDD